ncbi:MAG TPA: tetratricopeptide repeat protein, partial [Armatimonadetes bacterium]|nr:tetratricopeptide repeat protein [Armatimonadota bacterium]
MRIGKWLLHEWHLGRGISAIQRGDYDRALLHLDRALIYMPQSIWASLYKAYSAVCAGDEGMARGLLNIAVEDIGERPGVLVLAGRVWYELGELDTADC